MLEFLYFPKIKKETINKLVRVENSHLIEEGRSKDKGTLYVAMHYSNWELMAFSFPLIFDISVNIVTKMQASKGLNNKINRYRELSGNEMIEIGHSLKKIFGKLKNNELIAFLADQSAHPDYSVYADFFGKKVPAFSGPAKFVLKERSDLIFGYINRCSDYTYTLKLERIDYDDLNEYSDDNIKELTQRIQSKFETVISENPGQWLWFHKRFKHMKI